MGRKTKLGGAFCYRPEMSCPRMLLGAGCAVALLLGVPAQATPVEDDEQFPSTQAEIMAGPAPVSEAECRAKRHALWVTAEWVEKGRFSDTPSGGSACIRYFPSSNVAGAEKVLVWIHGDRVKLSGIRDGSFQKMVNGAGQMAEWIRMPTIFLSRPGVYGSTGAQHPYVRRTPQEAALVAAAIDALKDKYNWSRLYLSGQSGGGGLVGALLTLGRPDIECAMITSGSVATKMSLVERRKDPGKEWMGRFSYEMHDPIEHVAGIAPDASRRIFVFADRLDARVGYQSQRSFYQAVAERGHHAVFVEGFAKDSLHHTLTSMGVMATSLCAQGVDDEAIIAQVTRGDEPRAREILRSSGGAAGM